MTGNEQFIPARYRAAEGDVQDIRASSWRWVAGVNGLGAVIAGGFAVAGAIDPTLIADGSVTSLVRLYAETYAVRAVPLAGALVVLLARRRPGPAVVPLLVVAGLAQAGDAVIGATMELPAMIAGAAAFAVIHLATAAWVRSRTRVAPTARPAQPARFR